MANLEYTIEDFSGGITDNISRGDKSRAARLDNLYIDDQRNLITRDGSAIFSSTNHTVTTTRINQLFSFLNDTVLLAQSRKNIYWMDPTWTALLGPSGNTAFSFGDDTSVVSHGVWNRHIYTTNDAGTRVQKIYQDENDDLQIRNAGLPRPDNTDLSDTLDEAIALANDLRTVMLAHMNDVGSHGTDVHRALDSASIATITAAALATDAASLYTLVSALVEGYNSHVSDVIPAYTEIATYHFVGFLIGSNAAYTSINFRVSIVDAPETAAEAATILNDLREKYIFHTQAPFTHDFSNGATVLNQHQPNLQPVYIFEDVLHVTPNYLELFDLANNLKEALNEHFANDDAHIEAQTDVVEVDDCYDLTSWKILIMHLRYYYGIHYEDADTDFLDITQDTSSGSASVTDCKVSGVPLSMAFYNGFYVISSVFPNGTTVGSGGAGTYTASNNATATTNDSAAKITQASYHVAENAASPDDELATGKNSVGSTLQSWLDLLLECLTAFNYHNTNTSTHRELPGAYLVTPIPVLTSHIYAAHYHNSYEDSNGITFEDNGPILFSKTIETVLSYTDWYTYSNLSTEALNATGEQRTENPTIVDPIPLLSNGSTENYDTDNVTIKLFRTANNGVTFYLLDELTNDEEGTGYDDTTHDVIKKSEADTVFTLREKMYTTGGVVENDPPPRCKYIHVEGKFTYFGNITEEDEDGGAVLENRVRQSIEDDPDAAPAQFYADIDDDVIVGVSGAKSNPIVFGSRAVYRLEGHFNELGNGFIAYQKISENIGCIGQNSIVKTQAGVFFAGTDGFYFTDSFSVQKISDEYNNTYKLLTATAEQRRRIFGEYDPINQLVWWSMQTSSASEVDVCYVFHTSFGVKPNGVFSTFSGSTSFKPTALRYFQRKMHRADARGYLFYHDSSLKSDPKVDTTLSPTLWGSQTIIHDYISINLDLGNSKQKKYGTWAYVEAQNESNLSLQITSTNDFTYDKNLKPIIFRGNCFWGNASFHWGDPRFIWNGSEGLINARRRFPAQSHRFYYKQLRLTNAEVQIRKSDESGFAQRSATSGGLFNVTLLGGEEWPTHVLDHVIVFSDLPDTRFTVTSRTSDTVLVCSDSGGVNTANSAIDWIMYGKPKNERLHLLKISMDYVPLKSTQKTYLGDNEEGQGANTL